MKKIFYIILVIVALMVISRFVKEGNQENTAPTTTVVEAVEAVDAAAVGNAEIAAPDEEMIEETVVDGVDDNGMEEETVLDVEETAPADTQNEGETIVKE